MSTTLKPYELTPGRYRRTWGGYTIEVDVQSSRGRLVETAPSGFQSDPMTMPDAVYEPIEVNIESSFLANAESVSRELAEAESVAASLRSRQDIIERFRGRLPALGDRVRLRRAPGTPPQSVKEICGEIVTIVGLSAKASCLTGVMVTFSHADIVNPTPLDLGWFELLNPEVQTSGKLAA